MNTEHPIDEQLADLGRRLGSGDGSMSRRVLEQVEREGAVPLPRRSRAWWSVGAAIAASLLVLLLMQAFDGRSTGNSGSLYAQVVAATQTARTIHFVGRIWNGESWQPFAQLDFDQGAGVREVNVRGDRTETRISDGQHEWQFTSGSSIVRRRKSDDSMGEIVRKLLKTDWLDQAKRDPTGDQLIDGEPAQLYVRDMPDAPGVPMRVRMWLDRSTRIRRAEEMVLKDGKWTNQMAASIQYDVAIDRKLFTPDLPAQATIVDADEVRERNFSPETALYRQEVLGMTFAVHRVELLDNRYLAVISSIRPTDQTRRLVGDAAGHMNVNFAQYQLEDSSEESNKFRYQVYELGSAYEDGLLVKWHILARFGQWPDELKNRFVPSVTISAEGAWAQYMAKAGRKNWEEASPKSAIPEVDHKRGIAEFVGDVYLQASALETSTSFSSLLMQPWPMSDKEMKPLWDQGVVPRHERLSRSRTLRPRSLTLEEFQKEVANRLLTGV